MQAQIAVLSPRVSAYKNQQHMLQMEQNSLNQRMTALTNNKLIKDGEPLPFNSLCISYISLWSINILFLICSRNWRKQSGSDQAEATSFEVATTPIASTFKYAKLGIWWIGTNFEHRSKSTWVWTEYWTSKLKPR